MLKEINRTREKLDRAGESNRSKSTKRDQNARVDQIRQVMQDSSPWEQIHVSELLRLGLEEHRTRMATKFRAHFSLPADFDVSADQIEMAATDEMPDPNEYDPRQDSRRETKVRSAANVAPEMPRLESLTSQERRPSERGCPGMSRCILLHRVARRHDFATGFQFSRNRFRPSSLSL